MNDPTRTALPAPGVTASAADPAATAPPPGPSAASTVVPSPDRYVLGEEIARGGMGEVYRATDTVLSREVAVKVLQAKYGPASAAARRFADEARITGQLQHPAIPPVHDLGTLPDGRPFLAMKLIKGETLAEQLKARSDPAAERGKFVAVFEAICQAVAYAHAHGVIHRDLKPANVMVGNFGEVQVMDWGLAKVLRAGSVSDGASADPESTSADTEIKSLRDGGDLLTQAGAALGTPAFMPPEQAIGAVDQIDRRSDVFGLGGILAAILTGKPPFVGPSSESTRQLAAKGKVADCFARLDGSGADPELVALAKRCLAAEPDDRPADAATVATAVATLRAAADERARQAELDHVRAEAREQMMTVVNVARGKSEQIRDQAKACNPQDLAAAEELIALWGQASTAFETIEAALSAGSADASSREQLDNLGADIRAGTDRARLLVVQLRRVEKLIADLQAARMLAADAIDGSSFAISAASKAYLDSFREFGIDLRALDRETAIERLKQSSTAVQPHLFLAVLHWMTLVEREERARLWVLQAKSDTDQFRRRLGNALVIDGEDQLFLIYEQGKSIQLPALALDLLGNALQRRGNSALALNVLRNAERCHPADYWINVSLGDSLLDHRRTPTPAEIAEAVGCYRAALVARQLSTGVHDRLGRSLLLIGDIDGAIACYRKLSDLDPKFMREKVILAPVKQLVPSERAKWDKYLAESGAGKR